MACIYQYLYNYLKYHSSICIYINLNGIKWTKVNFILFFLCYWFHMIFLFCFWFLLTTLFSLNWLDWTNSYFHVPYLQRNIRTFSYVFWISFLSKIYVHINVTTLSRFFLFKNIFSETFFFFLTEIWSTEKSSRCDHIYSSV